MLPIQLVSTQPDGFLLVVVDSGFVRKKKDKIVSELQTNPEILPKLLRLSYNWSVQKQNSRAARSLFAPSVSWLNTSLVYSQNRLELAFCPLIFFFFLLK